VAVDVDRPTVVDTYWGLHTVHSEPFTSARESADYLGWRFSEYPLFRDFMDLWGRFEPGEAILDYGCGPGNDVVGFLLNTPAHVVGVDVSQKALDLAAGRVGLHRIDPSRVKLVRISDAEPKIPLESGAFARINSGGVLHHLSNPSAVLEEFRRVIRIDGEARVMVYNRNSIWFHLFTAYVRRIEEGRFGGLTADEAFARNTDGEDCPISRAYSPEHFVQLAEEAGFDAEYLGGYFGKVELAVYEQLSERAATDERLPLEHRTFLSELTRDEQGYPLYRGKHAGVGGSYLLRPNRTD
jgi:SAM-dependent methyltransferase